LIAAPRIPIIQRLPNVRSRIEDVLVKRSLLLLLILMGCDPAAPVTSPPPPPPTPPPVPLALAVNPPSRKATALPGGASSSDNAAVTLTGDSAATATWIATNRHPWITIVAASGTGNGTASWLRNLTGLASGTYVDTISIMAAGATGSPSFVIDTLQITTAPVPLTLQVTPGSRSHSAIQGTALPDDNAAVTLSGDNAATTAWSATKRKSWTTLTTAAGTGSGSVSWQRAVASLGVGTWVDTITVTANGATGSPATVIDTLVITPVPVPLTLALSPTSRSISVTQGNAAPGTTAAVTLAGDNSATTHWTATKKQSWTTLTTASGTGSGTVAWSRSSTTLAVGTYVDTITVTASGATGSPATVVDTLIVAAPSGGPVPDLGVNASLHGKQFFPPTDPWNTAIDTAPVDPNSDAILSTVGVGKSLHPDFGSDAGGGFGYSYVVVPDATARSSVAFDYAGESDPGPYPIPANPPIEPQSDHHLFIITQNEWKLYELWATGGGPGSWTAGSGAIFNLTNGTQRPAGWTSADAAGLPMMPGMVRYDEVYGLGAITHALRFTLTHTRRAYLPPANHYASSLTGTNYAPMGMRVRLKANFDISGYPAPMQVILRALKKYGMMVADNGGDFFLSGVTDLRWDNDVNSLLKQVHVSDFEVVQMNGIVTQ